MDLVKKQDTRSIGLGRFLYYLSNILFSSRNGRQFMKTAMDRVCVNSGESGFSGSGRTPKYVRENVPLLDRQAQRFARANELLLADEYVQISRTKPAGKRFHITC